MFWSCPWRPEDRCINSSTASSISSLTSSSILVPEGTLLEGDILATNSSLSYSDETPKSADLTCSSWAFMASCHLCSYSSLRRISISARIASMAKSRSLRSPMTWSYSISSSIYSCYLRDVSIDSRVKPWTFNFSSSLKWMFSFSNSSIIASSSTS